MGTAPISSWRLKLSVLARNEEHVGEGNEYLFPDGSSVSISNVSTDTWFNDDGKKATHGRTSSSLADLEAAYEVYWKNREWKVCVEVAQRAVHLHSKDAWGWIQRSSALHCLGMTREAFENLKPAAGLFPGNITIRYSLACYAAQLGDTEAAKDWLESVFDVAYHCSYAGAFERFQKKASADPNLVTVQAAVPRTRLSWKIKKYLGM